MTPHLLRARGWIPAAATMARVPIARTVLILLISGGGPYGALATPARAQTGEYVVGPQDVLAVTVANEPSLSGRFTVVPDGTFSYPLLGTVKVGGLSVRAVERELATRLADGFLANPVVSVALEQFGSQRVLVVGEVRQAGSYPLTGPTTLLEMLLKAGAPTQTAGAEALVVRGGGTASPTPEGKNVVRVDLEALQRGDLSQNVALREGDMVFVPRAEPAVPIYVTGLVKTPGAYQLPKGATVLQALAQAGGVTDRGSTRRVTIVRKAQDRTIELKAALHDGVQPGDTIVVHRRLF